ncbi:hypothetical protein P879_08573 [Paragonimus westermani]|uniref:RNA helicase n=1 Tax=Paragonimus westermani TaxID=34504 RepID=A0A8T0D1E9_9TREM|nr:hypothetical protein P879_08573 [Paragonimus westermani]
MPKKSVKPQYVPNDRFRVWSRSPTATISLGDSPPKERPPGLKGKEIGLWYAARSKAKKPGSKRKTADVVTLDTTGINVAHIRDVIVLSKQAGLGLQSSASDNVSFLSTTSLNEDLEEIREATSHDIEIYADKGDQIQTYLLDQLSTNSDPTAPPKKLLVRRVELDAEMQRELHSKQLSYSYSQMLKTRSKLPAFDLRNDITNAVKNNQVLVISGETGCGKTTQVPQFLLESEVSRGNGSITRIVVTQPRRISAISVAERVAAERGEPIGNSIGYQVQLERRYPRRIPGSIMYVTTGMLLQWLHSDPLLENISHVVVDEVHEREFLGDFLLTVLRNIAKLRPELRIILMSATLNADEISAYFSNCPKLHIPGRLFPVQTFFLEDVLRMTCFWLPDAAIANMAREQKSYLTRRYIGEGLSKGDARKATSGPNNEFHKWLMEQQDQSPNSLKILRTVDVDAYPMSDLIVHLTNYILQTSDHGSILIFVPGIAAIRETIKQMRASNPHLFGESSNLVRIYPLHSQLAVSKQRGLFDPPPPGQRKVIIATNIAETSITIEDVVYVIDCGRIKVTNYDASSNTNSLAPMLVSRANAAQRRGRAGRVRLGFCYHLFSKFVYDNVMPEFLLPEMLRMRLEDVILRIKLLQLGPVSEFLANCMSPPDQKAVERTLHFLHEIQALNLSDGAFGKDCGHLSRQQKKLTARQLRRQRKQMARNATKNANVIVISDDEDDGKDANSQSEPLPSKGSYIGLPGDNAPLSPLGEHLARLPMNPQLAKLLILGALFGCLEPALAVASCLNYRDPFEIPLDKQISAAKGRLGLSQNTLSDHWVYVTVVQVRYRFTFCVCRNLGDGFFLRLCGTSQTCNDRTD